MTKPLCIVDCAYLAGLIDGEGCITVSRTHTSASAKACRRGFSYRASVYVAMTDGAPLIWARQSTCLGSIVPKKANKVGHKPGLWAARKASYDRFRLLNFRGVPQ